VEYSPSDAAIQGRFSLPQGASRQYFGIVAERTKPASFLDGPIETSDGQVDLVVSLAFIAARELLFLHQLVEQLAGGVPQGTERPHGELRVALCAGPGKSPQPGSESRVEPRSHIEWA
jgi:hypothetical protein